MKLNNNAYSQPLTLNPGTMSEVHFTIKTLIKRRNNPNVNRVIGMVSMMSIGFTKLFNSPITNATKMAVSVPFTRTPLCKRKAANSTATDVTSVFKINLFINVVFMYACKVNRIH